MPIAGPAHWLVPILGSAGRHAVLVFYLLSGFLIVQSIGHNIRTHGVFAGRSYFFSRLARLYPPLLLAIVSTTLVAWLINGLALNGSVSQPFKRWDWAWA
ncbi:MAG: hypothetical protein IPO19_14005 [Rhodoferax sp.]|nr:hypothetical protein [Rhodoferax sp.]